MNDHVNSARVTFLDRPVLAIALLYTIQLLVILGLVFAAGSQALLTKEEASSDFVNPTFLELHLQHHVFSTNFYAYAFFDVAGHFIPGLFYARFAKAVVMAFLPAVLYLYMRRRFSWSGTHAFGAALAISLLPGVVDFSWLGTEWGLDTLAGFLALWLALFETPAAIIGSCLAAALAAGCYGSGLVFLPVVFVHHVPRLRRPRLGLAVLAGSFVIAAVFMLPLLWITNIQTLFTGGGGSPTLAGVVTRLSAMCMELFVRGDSYYFFSHGAPALGGIAIGFAAVAGLVVMAIRQPFRSWPIFAVCFFGIVIYAIAGNVIGIRRAMPVVVSLGISAALLLRVSFGNGSSGSRTARNVIFYGLMCAAILFGLAKYNDVRRSLASSVIALPHDFEFRLAPGENMASAVGALISRAESPALDWNEYEPDRTLSILYRLTLPHPIVSATELVATCDRHGWSIPSRSPRFSGRGTPP